MTTHLKKLVYALALVVLACAPGAAQAQGRQGGMPSREQMIARTMERMTEALTLTPEQVAQIQPIVEDFTDQRMEMFAELQGQGPEMRQTMRPVMQKMTDKMNAKIEPLLTPEQAAKYKEMQEQQRKRAEQSGRGF